jgi:hypothetical protein
MKVREKGEFAIITVRALGLTHDFLELPTSELRLDGVLRGSAASHPDAIGPE